MVNLTALVKATITLPLAVSSPAATFPLIFAQQFLLNLNRFPLFCGDSKTPAPPPPLLCRRRRRKGGYPRREALGVRETNPPAKRSYVFKGGNQRQREGCLGLAFSLAVMEAGGKLLETRPAFGSAGGAAGL